MGLNVDRKVVIVTRPTLLANLQKKFSTRSQARFQIVTAKKRELARSGTAPKSIDRLADDAFNEVDAASSAYDHTVQRVQRDLDTANLQMPIQTIDRDFLPNFVFGPHDIIVTIGQDGLVANTAKYVLNLPIIAVNPDPQRNDGILLPFLPQQARAGVLSVLHGHARHRAVTLAQATLADGQTLLAFNELFIGRRNHTSARYRLTLAQQSEIQSSSGLLVCTGAGSTGWLSSVCKMAAGVTAAFGAPAVKQLTPPKVQLTLDWADPQLVFVVREPFVSRTSSAKLIAGFLPPAQEIVVESEMASDGVIFSDGVEADFLEFNSGAIARIQAAAQKAQIVIPE